MDNLAGYVEHGRCTQEQLDKIVVRELRRAGIDAVPAQQQDGEVNATVGGALPGGIYLHRAWYYWVAVGKVPMDVAKELYAHPSRDSIRAGGDCTCPDPVGSYVSSDGYVGTYHIDDLLGLYVFAETVKRHFEKVGDPADPMGYLSRGLAVCGNLPVEPGECDNTATAEADGGLAVCPEASSGRCEHYKKLKAAR